MPYKDPERRRAHQRARWRSRRAWKRRVYRGAVLALADVEAEGVQIAVEIGSAVAIRTRDSIYLLHTETMGLPPGKVTGIGIRIT